MTPSVLPHSAIKQLRRHTTFVYSPDDGGWYGEQFDLTTFVDGSETSRSRVTKRIYPSEDAANKHALNARFKDKNVWEEWS